MKGRLRIAVVIAVCLVAIVALPAIAQAASFAAEYPVDPGTYHSASFASVEVIDANVKSATITIDGGSAVRMGINAGSSTGSWSSSEVLSSNGVTFVTFWTWTAGPATDHVTLIGPASGAVGAHTVAVAVTDVNGVVSNDSWTYTVTAQPPYTPPSPVTADNTCVACHFAGNTAIPAQFAQDYSLDNGMGAGTGDAGKCAACHAGAFSPHGFEMAASGHSTELLGKRGVYTKFDGSQGVTIDWESEIASASLNPTWLVEAGFPAATAPLDGSGNPLTSISVGQEGVVTSDWNFPTVNVFWATADTDAPAGAIKGLTKDSVITCEDCHTGLTVAGPHGAADTFGIDPAFPADYSYAELTKWVITNPSGIKVRSSLDTQTQVYTSGQAVICSKCHDLENLKTGTAFGTTAKGYWMNATSTPSNPTTITTDTPSNKINVAAVGASNTAHASHHQDQADGSAQCVNCHIGVPHGWKRPRLLVNTGWDGSASAIGAGVIEGDEAPYLDPLHLGVTRSSGGIRMNANGHNGMGMLTLSAVDNHFLTAGGAANWSEPSCQACNDHAGEDGIRIK